MLASRALAMVLAAAFAAAPVLGPAGPICADCCPAPDTRPTTISALGCCGEGCPARLAAAQDRACLVSHRPADVAWDALSLTIPSLGSAVSKTRSQSAAFFWLPACARPGTTPLRL
jgi:hypothetical protein